MNISLSGLYVATDREVPVGSNVYINFRLPGTGEDSLILATGRIAWLNSGRKKTCQHLPAGFGLEFLEIVGTGLPILRKTELRNYVEQHPAK
jgi:Tfp pilus assembly protein PilZ